MERLAHHTRRGEVWDKAARYLRQAGTKVFLRSADREAAACFEQALDALRRLPEHPDAIARSLEADTAEAHYRQALALAEELGLRPLVAHCHLGLGRLYERTGKREEAQEHLTAATTMYREMDMRFWLEQAEAELRQP